MVNARCISAAIPQHGLPVQVLPLRRLPKASVESRQRPTYRRDGNLLVARPARSIEELTRIAVLGDTARQVIASPGHDTAVAQRHVAVGVGAEYSLSPWL